MAKATPDELKELVRSLDIPGDVIGAMQKAGIKPSPAVFAALFTLGAAGCLTTGASRELLNTLLDRVQEKTSALTGRKDGTTFS